jgi:hypothetical protein
VAGIGMSAAGSARGGVVRCWIDHGAVVVPAAYGPIAGDFILDLTAPHSQLHDTAAQTAGWTQSQAHWTLRLAGKTRHDFQMMVTDLDARIIGFPTNIAGILGADVIGRSTLDLDLEPCRLRLSQASPRRANHGLWTTMISGAPAVFAAISDGVTARAGWFAIDTASAGSRIADARFSRALPKSDDPGGRERPPARLRAVSLNGRLIEQTPAGLMSFAPPGLSGSLGVSIWRTVHVRLDGRSFNARP